MSAKTAPPGGGGPLEDAYERKLTWAFQLTEAGQDERAMQILTRLLADYTRTMPDSPTRSLRSRTAPQVDSRSPKPQLNER